MSDAKRLTLRPADAKDRDLLLAWRNDPQTVAATLTGRAVSDAEHGLWFQARLSDPDCVLLVAEEGGHAVGLVRLERIERHVAEVHISLDPKDRGRGVGSQVLDSAVRRTTVELPGVDMLVARIRAENRASLRVFEKAGFRVVERGDVIKAERWVP